jgi:hypothetical protein
MEESISMKESARELALAQREDQEQSNNKHDEMDDKYSIAVEEDAAKELGLLLESIDKNDLGNAIKKELRRKLEAATSKLTVLFDKQRALVEEEEFDPEATETTASVEEPPQSKSNRKGVPVEVKNIVLTKKVSALIKQVELSEQKSRSVTLQWSLDKVKYKEDAARRRDWA